MNIYYYRLSYNNKVHSKSTWLMATRIFFIYVYIFLLWKCLYNSIRPSYITLLYSTLETWSKSSNYSTCTLNVNIYTVYYTVYIGPLIFFFRTQVRSVLNYNASSIIQRKHSRIHEGGGVVLSHAFKYS